MTSTTAANLSSNWGSDDDADDDDDDDDGGFDGDDFDDFEDVDDEDDEDFERRLSSSSSVMEASSSESLKRDIFLLPLIVPEKVFYRNFTVFQFFTSLNFSTKASQKMDRERKKIRYKRMKLETKKRSDSGKPSPGFGRARGCHGLEGAPGDAFFAPAGSTIVPEAEMRKQKQKPVAFSFLPSLGFFMKRFRLKTRRVDKKQSDLEPTATLGRVCRIPLTSVARIGPPPISAAGKIPGCSKEGLQLFCSPSLGLLCSRMGSIINLNFCPLLLVQIINPSSMENDFMGEEGREPNLGQLGEKHGYDICAIQSPN